MKDAQTIVAKLGGDMLEADEQLDALAGDLSALADDGARIVVLHGGGRQATALQKRLGMEPNIVAGRRITDAETLEICKMVYAGRLSVDLTTRLGKAGLDSIGLSGVSSGLIRAVKRPPRVVSGGGDEPIDFGHVGDIVSINVDLLELLLSDGYVPVMNSLGADEAGNAYNINADIAATRVAAALNADHLTLLSAGVPGVLRDKDDPDSRVPRLDTAEARRAIEEGVIQGGMIPKVEESLSVLQSGVGAIHILGALEPGHLREALESPGAFGTVLVS